MGMCRFLKKIIVDLQDKALCNLPIDKFLFLYALAKKKQKYYWRAKLPFLQKHIVNESEDEILNLTDRRLVSASYIIKKS